MSHYEDDDDEFKTPDWEDTMDFWDRCTVKERLKYIEDALECDQCSSIAVAIANQKWEHIPDPIAEMLEGNSQLGNDVFNAINDEW